MAAAPTPDGILRLAVAAVEAALADGYALRPKPGEAGATAEAARRLGVDASRIRQWLRLAAARLSLKPDGSRYDAGVRDKGVNADVAAEARRVKDLNASLSRQVEELKTEAKEAGALRELAFKLSPERVDPVRYEIEPKGSVKGREIPMLFTSDFQAGEVIRPEEVRGLNAYNLEIFRDRYRRLIASTIHIVNGHHGGAPMIVYLRGGDSISGGIHEELADTDDGPAPDQAIAVIQEETAGIEKLADAFGKVVVVSCPGNHDRTTKKPRSKSYTSHSFERIIQFALEAAFRNDDRVSFLTHASGDVYFELYGVKFLLTHGDRIGSRGGTGFVGPVATISRGAKKTHDQYAAEDWPVDYMLIGHFHSPMALDDLGVIVNGTLAGFSEYARDLRVRAKPPVQKLLFVDDKWGLTTVRTIQVEPRRPRGAGGQAVKIAS